MVGAGVLMIVLALLSLYLDRTGKREKSPLFLRILSWSFFLPYIANTAGWLLTELGRQPWIVYGLQKTADAVSPNVPATTVLFSLIGFAALYGVLMVADVYLLNKYAKRESDPEGPEDILAPAGAG